MNAVSEKTGAARVFGKVEAAFDVLYLAAAVCIGLVLLFDSVGNGSRSLAGIMALVLAGGDAFHLIPRINLILSGREEELRAALGRGKQIASITMTVFYLLLWQIGLRVLSPAVEDIWTYILYLLAALRILLCLLPQNRWEERFPPVSWGVRRNIPFFIQGMLVAALFFVRRDSTGGMGFAWLAILLSFLFYLPVVLFANKNPKIGMLMLPKTCTYLWILAMCLSL